MGNNSFIDNYRKVLMEGLIHKSKIYGAYERQKAEVPQNCAKRDELNEKIEKLDTEIEDIKNHLLYDITNVFYNIQTNRFGLVSRFTKKGIYFGSDLISYSDIYVVTQKQFDILDEFHNTVGPLSWMNPTTEIIEKVFADNIGIIKRLELFGKLYGRTSNGI